MAILLGTPSNLELRKRRGVVRLAFNDIGLTGLVGDVDVDHAATQPKMMLFVQDIIGEVSEET